MQVRELSWDEVVTAGTVIFGPSFGSFARGGAWRGELKTAYRRRVLETHPDRAALLGRSEAELVREFRAVAEAYELLVQLRAGAAPEAPAEQPAAAPPPRAARPRRTATPRPAPAAAAAAAEPPRPRPQAARRPQPSRPATAARAAGPAPARPTTTATPTPTPTPEAKSARSAPRARARPPAAEPLGSKLLPRRRLRLAEFLYYAGLVPWSDFVGAVAWQRKQRPAVGRIAVDFGYLSGTEVWEILERRRSEGGACEPFGEFAVRRGYLTPFQLLALLGQQLRLQRPIGRYFVERGLVSDGEIDAARAAIFRHNVRHPL